MLKSIPCFGVGWGFWSRPTQPKVPRSVQICIGGEGLGWSRPTQPKVPRSVQICIFRGAGEGWWSRPTQPKVPRSIQICIFSGGGRGGCPDRLNPKHQDLSKSAFFLGGGEGVVAQTNIPEILEWGHSRNFEPKILATGMCSASQIVCGD